MDSFDDRYVLLQAMYEDSFFPQYLVDKIKWQLISLIEFLETGERDTAAVQEKCDEFTLFVNSLKQEFTEQESDLENVARQSIFDAVEYILHWFAVDLSAESALREREW